MGEINIDYLALMCSIKLMKVLEKGTGYELRGTASFINHSYGKMFDTTNDCYEMLMNIEEEFIQIVKKTNNLLNKVGVDFEKAEIEINNIISNTLVWVDKNEKN